MNNRELLKSALSTCMVLNGNLTFINNYSAKDLMSIYGDLSEALLDYNIPHNRVVGIKYEDSAAETSILRTHNYFNMSPIDLTVKAQRLIPTELGGSLSGNIDGDETFARTTEYRKPEFIESTGRLMYIHNNLLIDEDNPDPRSKRIIDRQKINRICSETIQYFADQVANTWNVNVPMLIKDVDICETKTKDINIYTVTFFYVRGTGVLEFEDTAKFFLDDAAVMPCRTIFDLGSIVSIRYPEGAGSSLQLVYFDDISEDAFEQILREYGKEL